MKTTARLNRKSLNTNKQRGIALITVLLIVAIITIVASEMAVRLQMQIKRTDNLTANQQAYWFAVGGEALAALVLNESKNAKSGQFNLSQPWAVEEMSFPLQDGGQITGHIQDLNSCFNINAAYLDPDSPDRNVSNSDNIDSSGTNSNSNSDSDSNSNTANDSNDPNNPNAKTFDIEPDAQFLQLLEHAGIDNFDAEQIRDAVLDWLDKDSITRSFGAEDYMYEAKIKAYLPANGYFVDESELKLIEGLDTPEGAKKLSDLLEYVCVIPNQSSLVINVNTIKEEQAALLAAMFGSKLSVQAAKSIITNRPIEGYDKIETFWALSEIKAIGKISNRVKQQFSVTSEYFKLKTTTEYNESWFNLSSIFSLNNKGKFVVIAREIGV